MSGDATTAELGMDPFESVRWAWDALWSAVHALAPSTPAAPLIDGFVRTTTAE